MAHFNYNKPSKLGSELTPEEQRYVLAAYVHRFTGDNKPDWASKEWKDGQPYPLQFKDDKDWLANTRFQTNKAGSLDIGVCYTRADAELNMVLVNNREVDLYMLGQGEGLYKRNNGWAAHL